MEGNGVNSGEVKEISDKEKYKLLITEIRKMEASSQRSFIKQDYDETLKSNGDNVTDVDKRNDESIRKTCN
ncbi:MAG: hypothetical protein U0525_05535 [Patescibacteria group bacterium]